MTDLVAAPFLSPSFRILPHANPVLLTTTAESALKSFLSGGVGGLCVVLVGHPFDLIKVRMQTGATAGTASVFGILASTFRMEGIRGLYRGVSAPITAVSPLFAVSFWGYDMGKRVISACQEFFTGAPVQTFTIPQVCVAGGLSAIPTTLLMAPSERIKCLLQVQESAVKPKYNGMMDCAVQLFREGGVRSVFKGTGATLLRDFPGSVAWFGVYELSKRELMLLQGIDPATGALSPLAILCAGGLGGMACWTVSIPADVLKSRFQTAPEGKYRGLMDVYRELVAKEGLGALFTGIRPALIRAFPANAACFFGMEVSKKMLAFMD